MAIDVQLDDLVIAYRKAKADCFHENGNLTALGFAKYETELETNLKALKAKIDNGGNNDILDQELIGHYVYVLKEIKLSPQINDELVYYSDSRRHWEKEKIEKVSFRIIGQHSVDLRILSALWIEKIGYKLEALVSENSYGCRLKRKGQTANKFVGKNNELDKFELGLFRPYFGDYKRWQSKGIEAIERALTKGQKIIAVTADIKKFYHRIDPSFLLDPVFISSYQVNYSQTDRELTELFVRLLKLWSAKVASDVDVPDDFKYLNHSGVPVGLSASKVIANLLLIFLDREIETELQPVYYGRYVDDLFLVLEDNGKIDSSDTFWKFVESRITSIDRAFDLEVDNVKSNDGPVIKIPYSKNSLIRFGKGKEKLFILEGSSGDSFIKTIKDALNENSSEWRMLPDSEADLDTLAQEMAKASSDSEEAVNGLRKSDGISIQRLKFALQLRNFEAVVGILPKEMWADGLNKFFVLARDFVLAPDKIATYAKYHPRLITLALRAGNEDIAQELFYQINGAWNLLSSRMPDSLSRKLLEKAKEYNNNLLAEAIYSSLDFRKDANVVRWREIFLVTNLSDNDLLDIGKDLFFADLHATAFKSIFFDFEVELSYIFHLSSKTSLQERLVSSFFDINKAFDFLRNAFYQGLFNEDEVLVPNALFFSTRPLTILDLTMIFPEWATPNSNYLFKQYADLFKLNAPDVISPQGADGQLVELNIANDSENLNKTFALTSFQTEEKSWISWVRGDGFEPDKFRYTRLFRLLNDVLKCRTEIHYVVFPELSIPRKVLMYVSAKLRTKGISLIAGIEYEKRAKTIGLHSSIIGEVSNQLVYILNVSSKGMHEQVCITQEKTDAAIHEESELFSTAGQIMVPKSQAKYLIQHGGLFFSGLICNDLLNIDYRQSLRGRIDALIIIEWNQDVETYDPIIKSTSNDLHCFVLQVNNRKYGDTRLRAPYKESYNRDKVRVRGGELDYFVVTTLEVEKLREFQRHHRSPAEPFKPVPTGYIMSNERRGREFPF